MQWFPVLALSSRLLLTGRACRALSLAGAALRDHHSLLLHFVLLLPDLLLELERLVPILLLRMLQLAQLLAHLLDFEGGRGLSLLLLLLLLLALHEQSRHLTLQLVHLGVLFRLAPEKLLIGALLLLEGGQGVLEVGDLAEDLRVHLVGLRLLHLERFELAGLALLALKRLVVQYLVGARAQVVPGGRRLSMKLLLLKLRFVEVKLRFQTSNRLIFRNDPVLKVGHLGLRLCELLRQLDAVLFRQFALLGLLLTEVYGLL